VRPPWADDASPWDRIELAGVAFKGTVEVTGAALKRRIATHRSGGTNGERITDRGLEAVELTIELTAYEAEHVDQLDTIRDRLIPRTSPARGQRAAVSVQHPALAWAGIAQVYPVEVGLPKLDGQTLKVTIKVREYREPSAAAAVRRPAPAVQNAQVAAGVAETFSRTPIPAPSASGATNPPNFTPAASFSR
jgi:hypothetical protein